ncbi:hypothetical protein Tco_1397548, partial [Tanacetum coccineum]
FVPELVYQEFMPPEDDEDPEEDDDEDPEEDPSDYPTDRDDDDDEEEPSGDKADDEEEDEDDEEEEEEHLAPLDSITVAFPAVDHETPVSLPSDIEVVGLLAIPTLPPSSLSPWSSPLPQIPSPPLPPILSPLPVSPPLPISSPPLPASPTYPLGYRAAMIRLRAETPSVGILDLMRQNEEE